MAIPQTWFITGSSRGFGRALAIAALAAGDQVVATARRPQQLADLAEQYGDSVLALPLDVTDPAAAEAAVTAGVTRFGRLDVIVNNAGYANIAPLESAPEDDVRRQFEANFWGVYNVSKAALASLRSQGGGTVIQFSSVGGRVGGTPGLGAYQAAKFAVDGLTRVLAAESAPFGIRYLVVEPSGFATDWAGASMSVENIPEEYQATVGVVAEMLRSDTGSTVAGDPERAAEILVRLAKHEDLPSHLLLGATAAHMALDYSRSQIAQASSWHAVSASADFGAEYPVELPTGTA